MSNETNEFFAAALDRMTSDLQTAHDLFGAAVFAPSAVMAHLFACARPVCDADAPESDVNGGSWSARALALLNNMSAAGDSAARTCIAAAIDDPDPRIRGVALCMLSSLGNGEDERVDATIAEEFASRRPLTADRPPWDLQATSMPTVMRGIFAALRAKETVCRLNKEIIEAHAGPDASAIQLGWAHALPFLQHAESGRRLAALRAVAHAGKDAAEASIAIASLAAHDADSQVRVAAILAYVAIFRGAKDRNALRFLAEFVLDDSQGMLLRFAAYNGLFGVLGSPRAEHPLSRARPDTLERLRNSVPPLGWPVEVNWKLVHACAYGAGAEKGDRAS